MSSDYLEKAHEILKLIKAVLPEADFRVNENYREVIFSAGDNHSSISFCLLDVFTAGDAAIDIVLNLVSLKMEVICASN